ncbi:MAG TPA: hypothetical protein VKY62_04055 [Devosia sp.]|nr:hypothetical protein [Devosia sp.]
MKFEPLIGMARQAKLRRMKMECDPQCVLDLAAERDDYKRGAEVEARLGDEARAECDQLRAEVEALRTAAAVSAADANDAEREVEALRKDAERWRMARRILTVEAIEDAYSDFVNFGQLADERENIRADSAIDAAMAAKEGE